MHSTIVGFVLAILSANALAASQVQQAATASTAITGAPSCIHTIFKQPSFNTICTSHSTTLTFTSYTDCGVGCTLETRHLGVGLPCRTVRTNPGATAEVVTSCKPLKATMTKTVTRLYTRPTVTPSL
ncbi:hypothetical protein E8E12_008660 [Didymella heteroderae]|uniref:Uncharacterized protein n=1 Tax=Didymella heteroderae TaxID=1769908 RepID=A0A9P5C3W3_9PLEO|nr:hypothetical protein E8E12_008660 [Didymella heteroderae]